MRSFLPLLLLISTALAESPKCPDGVKQDDTFKDDTFYYYCGSSGTGVVQGCITKSGEVIAFGENSVESSKLNGEVRVYCDKKNTLDGYIEHLKYFRFNLKPDNELRCSDGRKAGEEFLPTNASSFIFRCVVNKENGQDYSEFVGCSFKGQKINLAETKEIEGFNATCLKDGSAACGRCPSPSGDKGTAMCGNKSRLIGEEYTEKGTFRKKCTEFGGTVIGCVDSNGKVVGLGGKSIEKQNQNPTDQLRCSNGKKIGEEYIAEDNNRFVHRCNVSDYGNDASDIVGCMATDDTTKIPLGHNITVRHRIEICSYKDGKYSFSNELLPEIPCTFNGKEYKQYERFTVEDKFNFRCEPDQNGNAQVKFLNCRLPNGVPIGIGNSQKTRYCLTYTCKSQNELIVE